MQWTLKRDQLASQHWCPCSLATCSTNKGVWHLPWHWTAAHIKVHLHCIWTSFLPFPLAWNTVWLIYHWLGICYFFISLLRDIILYATGLWNCYNSHSQPVFNKLLAKSILASEHNLPQIITSLLRLQFILKVGWGLQENEIPFLCCLKWAEESIEGAPDENEHLTQGWKWVWQVPWTAYVLL